MLHVLGFREVFKGDRMCWVSCLLCWAHWSWVYLGYRSLTQSMQLPQNLFWTEKWYCHWTKLTWKWLEHSVIIKGAEVGRGWGCLVHQLSHLYASCNQRHSSGLIPNAVAHSEEPHLHSPKLQVWARMSLLSSLYLLDLILSPHPKATFQV